MHKDDLYYSTRFSSYAPTVRKVLSTHFSYVILQSNFPSDKHAEDQLSNYFRQETRRRAGEPVQGKAKQERQNAKQKAAYHGNDETDHNHRSNALKRSYDSYHGSDTSKASHKDNRSINKKKIMMGMIQARATTETT